MIDKNIIYVYLIKNLFPKKQSAAEYSRKKVSKLLYESVENVRQIIREKMVDELSEKTHFLGRLRYLLYTKPFSMNLIISFLLFIFFLAIGSSIGETNDSLIIAIYSLSVVIIWSFFAITTQIITPEPDVNYDERWSMVVCSMLTLSRSMEIRKINQAITTKELKKIIKRAIRSYHLHGEPFKLFLNISWGGIFIGCLPDPKFQKAIIGSLTHIKPIMIWNENKFGAICLLIVPFIGLIYQSRYRLPKVWLEHVLFQIEVEE